MTPATAAGPADTGQLAVPGASAPLATDRGHTTISPVVVEKIAARAASEVEGVGGVLRTGLSRLLPWTASAGPASADAAINRDTVTVDLTVNVLYPRPVGRVTAEVRDRVSGELARMCGLHTGRVDITVPELVRPAGTAGRRVE